MRHQQTHAWGAAATGWPQSVLHLLWQDINFQHFDIRHSARIPHTLPRLTYIDSEPAQGWLSGRQQAISRFNRTAAWLLSWQQETDGCIIRSQHLNIVHEAALAIRAISVFVFVRAEFTYRAWHQRTSSCFKPILARHALCRMTVADSRVCMTYRSAGRIPPRRRSLAYAPPPSLQRRCRCLPRP